MKHILHLSVLFSVILLSSCAFHSGMMTGNADLGDTDFQILTVGMGQAKTVHVFGIGGLSKDALVFEAKKNLYRAYPLGKKQAYANVSVDFKRSLFLIVNTTLATVTADLVQYGEISKADSLKYLRSATIPGYPTPLDSSDLGIFKPGELVMLYEFQNAVKGRVIRKILDKNKYIVEYLESRSNETTIVKESDLYLTGQNDSLPGNDFHVGNAVYFNAYGANSTLQTGIVYAIGTKNLLVKSGVLTREVKIEDCMKMEAK